MKNIRRNRGNVVVWVVLLVLIAAAAVYYFYFWNKPSDVVEPIVSPPPPMELPQEPQPEPEPEPEPEAPPPSDAETEPVQTETLPLLGESDNEVFEAASGLIGEAPAQTWLVSEGVVSKFVATVDALTAEELPQNIVPVRSPGGDFEVTSDDSSERVDPDTGLPIREYLVDPVNYQRYTAQVELLESLDSESISAFYQTYYPLLQQSYRELGHSEGEFNDRLLEVIDHLLAAPEGQGEIRLVKPEAYYAFVDPDLEGLSAGQKLLIRIGPDNASRVKAKLEELRNALQTHRE